MTLESLRRFKRSELCADALMFTDAGIEGLFVGGIERVLVLEILHAYYDHDVRGRRGVAGVAPVRTFRAI